MTLPSDRKSGTSLSTLRLREVPASGAVRRPGQLVVVLRSKERDAPGAAIAEHRAGAVIERRVIDNRLSNLNNGKDVGVLGQGRGILPSHVGQILQPTIPSRINDAKRLQPGCAGPVNACDIELVRARIEPNLVPSTDLGDDADDLAVPRIEDDWKARDCPGATGGDQNVLRAPQRNAGNAGACGADDPLTVDVDRFECLGDRIDDRDPRRDTEVNIARNREQETASVQARIPERLLQSG